MSTYSSTTGTPKVTSQQSTIIKDNGQIVTETVTTSTETVKKLKEVEVEVEEVVHDSKDVVEEEGELDMAWLAGQLAKDDNIASLELADEDLSEKDIVLLAKSLHTNTKLDKLDVQGNEINEVGLKAIAYALSINRTIEEFRIGSQKCVASDATEKILADAVAQNDNLLVFTYNFRNAKYQKIIDDRLAKNAELYKESHTRRTKKKVLVEDVEEVTKVTKSEEALEGLVIPAATVAAAAVANKASSQTPAPAQTQYQSTSKPSSYQTPAPQPPVASYGSDSKYSTANSLQDSVVLVEEQTVSDSFYQVTPEDASPAPVPAPSKPKNHKYIQQKQEYDAIILDGTAPSYRRKRQFLLARIQALSQDDYETYEEYVAEQNALSLELVELEAALGLLEPQGNRDVKALTVEEDPEKEVLTVGSGPDIFGALSKAVSAVGSGIEAAVDTVVDAATRKSASDPEVLVVHEKQRASYAAAAIPAAAAVATASAYEDKETTTRRARREFLLLRIQSLRQTDYETYEEYIAEQNALSLELVEIEALLGISAPRGNVDVKGLTVEEDPEKVELTVGQGPDVFGALGKIAGAVERGFEAAVDGIESGAKAAGDYIAANSKNNGPVLAEDSFEVVNALDQISTEDPASASRTLSPTFIAGDFSSSKKNRTPSIASTDSKGNRKGRFSLVKQVSRPPSRVSPQPPTTTTYTKSYTEIREEDFETYEEYLAAKNAASLVLVEHNEFQEPSRREIKQIEREVVGEENRVLAGISASIGRGISGVVDAVEDVVEDVVEAVASGPELKEDAYENKTVEELTTASGVPKKRGYVAGKGVSNVNVSETNGEKSWFTTVTETVTVTAKDTYDAVVCPDHSTPEAKAKTQRGQINAAATGATLFGLFFIFLLRRQAEN